MNPADRPATSRPGLDADTDAGVGGHAHDLPQDADVVIVGGGPRAISVVERLTGRGDAAAPVHVVVIDAVEVGAGATWRTDQSRHLLNNTYSAHTTIYPDQSTPMDGPVTPGPDLVDWSRAVTGGAPHPGRVAIPDADAVTGPPRSRARAGLRWLGRRPAAGLGRGRGRRHRAVVLSHPSPAGRLLPRAARDDPQPGRRNARRRRGHRGRHRSGRRRRRRARGRQHACRRGRRPVRELAVAARGFRPRPRPRPRAVRHPTARARGERGAPPRAPRGRTVLPRPGRRARPGDDPGSAIAAHRAVPGCCDAEPADVCRAGDAGRTRLGRRARRRGRPRRGSRSQLLRRRRTSHRRPRRAIRPRRQPVRPQLPTVGPGTAAPRRFSAGTAVPLEVLVRRAAAGLCSAAGHPGVVRGRRRGARPGLHPGHLAAAGARVRRRAPGHARRPPPRGGSVDHRRGRRPSRCRRPRWVGRSPGRHHPRRPVAGRRRAPPQAPADAVAHGQQAVAATETAPPLDPAVVALPSDLLGRIARSGVGELAALVRELVSGPQWSLDVTRLDRPDVHEPTPEHWQDWTRWWRRAELASISSPLTSPRATVNRAMAALRGQVARLVAGGAIAAASATRDVSGWFGPLGLALASGPPPERTAQLLALVAAGVVELLGEGTSVSVEDGVFMARSQVRGQEHRARAFVETRMSKGHVGVTDDPLLRSLLDSGRARLLRRRDADGELVATRSLDVTAETFLLVDAAGRPDPRIIVLGIPAGDVQPGSAIGATPGVPSPLIAGADRAAAQVLAHVRDPAPANR